MVGSRCFISPKLHVSKIKALFRLLQENKGEEKSLEGNVVSESFGVFLKVYADRKPSF